MTLLKSTLRRIRGEAGPRVAKTHQRAVIDIGSNSVRLVIYDLQGRSIIARHNEKIMAGLGRDLARTGRLSEDGVRAAIPALGRYRAILNALQIDDIHAIATAAVRDAEDGPDFVARALEEADLSVRVLSGDEEARYAGLGAAAGMFGANGVVGDLGGSSLELIAVDGIDVSDGHTYPLGPLALGGREDTSPAALEAHIAQTLRDAPALSGAALRFITVGGAWRAFAKVHMTLSDYPLSILNAYSLPASEAIDLCEDIIAGKSGVQSCYHKVARRREATMVKAALVLRTVLQQGRFETFEVSANGLREGLVFDGLNPEVRGDDPLIEGAKASQRAGSPQIAFGNALVRFLFPLLKTLPPVLDEAGASDERCFRAAAYLADIGSTLHPDHRAELARDLVMRAPIMGCSHRERAYLGLLVAARYDRKIPASASEKRLLSEAQSQQARALGALMRVGATFSARSATILDILSARLDDDGLCLTLDRRYAALVSELVHRRLDQAASLFGVPAQIAYD